MILSLTFSFIVIHHFVVNERGLKYTSGWFTVGLPTIEFFVVWWGLSALAFAALDWSTSGFTAFLIIAGSLVAAIASCVVTYPLLQKLAERGSAGLRLEGSAVLWKLGRKEHCIDLTRPYWCAVSAGTSGLGEAHAAIDLRQGEREWLTVHLHGADRGVVMESFPHPWFVDRLSITSAEGSWGFELNGADGQEAGIFQRLLQSLWSTRTANELFETYRKFPWERKPRPAFQHIKSVDTATCDAGETALINEIKRNRVSSPMPWLIASPDYLLGYHYTRTDMVKDLLRSDASEPERYYIIPLGCVTAEKSLPRPDMKAFLAGNAVIAALGGGGSVRMQNVTVLLIHGADENGNGMKLAFQWFNPGDEHYHEGEAFVKFINTRTPE